MSTTLHHQASAAPTTASLLKGKLIVPVVSMVMLLHDRFYVHKIVKYPWLLRTEVECCINDSTSDITVT